MKKFLFFLSTLFVANGLMAQDKVLIDGLYYYLYDDTKTASVTHRSWEEGLYSGNITIPESVKYENETYSVTGFYLGAFSGCSNLTSIVIPESVTSICESAFYGCSSLTSVTIPNSVTSIGLGAFSGCSSLTSIVIPKTVKWIGVTAFNGCSGLTSIEVEKENPIYDSRDNCNAIIETESNTLICGCKNTIIPNSVTSVGGFGGCIGLTSITIPNSVTSVWDFHGCTGLTSITLPNSVTSIGSDAFSGCSNLTSVVISESVEEIGLYAFYGCTNLSGITCYAAEPPELACSTSNPAVFENYNLHLYVPCESLNMYSRMAGWRDFRYIDCITSETVELTKDEVKVEPENTAAVFTMPQNESANSYTLTIQNNGVTFCTLTFNSQEQLSNIDFSTNKSYDLKAGVSAYQFTVTGLSEATNYGYSFKALASNKSVLKEYTGSFTTKNADGTGGSSQGGTSTAINGVSNAVAVTIVNNQILVNGEAPAFVVTVSGKKIANQNLKSGVYFVNVEGETVKVSVQ